LLWVQEMSRPNKRKNDESAQHDPKRKQLRLQSFYPTLSSSTPTSTPTSTRTLSPTLISTSEDELSFDSKATSTIDFNGEIFDDTIDSHIETLSDNGLETHNSVRYLRYINGDLNEETTEVIETEVNHDDDDDDNEFIEVGNDGVLETKEAEINLTDDDDDDDDNDQDNDQDSVTEKEGRNNETEQTETEDDESSENKKEKSSKLSRKRKNMSSETKTLNKLGKKAKTQKPKKKVVKSKKQTAEERKKLALEAEIAFANSDVNDHVGVPPKSARVKALLKDSYVFRASDITLDEWYNVHVKDCLRFPVIETYQERKNRLKFHKPIKIINKSKVSVCGKFYIVPPVYGLVHFGLPGKDLRWKDKCEKKMKFESELWKGGEGNFDQQTAFDTIVRRMKIRGYGGLIKLPTGTGKTRLALAIGCHFNQRMCIVVNSDIAFETDWPKDIREVCPGLKIAWLRGHGTSGKYSLSKKNRKAIMESDILIVMRQSYCNKDYPEDIMKRFPFGIIDEVPLICANKAQDALGFMGRRQHVIGLSGTMWRKNGTHKMLDWYIGHELYRASLVTRVSKFTRLLPVNIHTGSQVIETSTTYGPHGQEQEINWSKTQHTNLFNAERNKVPMWYILQCMRLGRRQIVFCDLVDHALLMRTICEDDIEIRALSLLANRIPSISLCKTEEEERNAGRIIFNLYRWMKKNCFVKFVNSSTTSKVSNSSTFSTFSTSSNSSKLSNSSKSSKPSATAPTSTSTSTTTLTSTTNDILLLENPVQRLRKWSDDDGDGHLHAMEETRQWIFTHYWKSYLYILSMPETSRIKNGQHKPQFEPNIASLIASYAIQKETSGIVHIHAKTHKEDKAIFLSKPRSLLFSTYGMLGTGANITWIDTEHMISVRQDAGIVNQALGRFRPRPDGKVSKVYMPLAIAYCDPYGPFVKHSVAMKQAAKDKGLVILESDEIVGKLPRNIPILQSSSTSTSTSTSKLLIPDYISKLSSSSTSSTSTPSTIHSRNIVSVRLGESQKFVC
jgi:hypothetical protein